MLFEKYHAVFLYQNLSGLHINAKHYLWTALSELTLYNDYSVSFMQFNMFIVEMIVTPSIITGLHYKFWPAWNTL